MKIKTRSNFFSLHYTLEKAHPDLDRESILRILERFESQRLISLSAKRIKGTPFARVNPSAYTYYNNRELRKAAEDAASRGGCFGAGGNRGMGRTRAWNYKMISVGFVAGLISGILLMWLKNIFPNELACTKGCCRISPLSRIILMEDENIRI